MFSLSQRETSGRQRKTEAREWGVSTTTITIIGGGQNNRALSPDGSHQLHGGQMGSIGRTKPPAKEVQVLAHAFGPGCPQRVNCVSRLDGGGRENRKCQEGYQTVGPSNCKCGSPINRDEGDSRASWDEVKSSRISDGFWQASSSGPFELLPDLRVLPAQRRRFVWQVCTGTHLGGAAPAPRSAVSHAAPPQPGSYTETEEK